MVELERIAGKIHKQLTKGEVPEMHLAARTKSNIVFDEKKQVYVSCFIFKKWIKRFIRI